MEILWQKPLKYSVVDALFLIISWMPATAHTGSPCNRFDPNDLVFMCSVLTLPLFL